MMDRAIKSNIIFISYIYFPLLCFFIANTIMSTILKSTKKYLFSRFHENLLLNFYIPIYLYLDPKIGQFQVRVSEKNVECVTDRLARSLKMNEKVRTIYEDS